MRNNSHFCVGWSNLTCQIHIDIWYIRCIRLIEAAKKLAPTIISLLVLMFLTIGIAFFSKRTFFFSYYYYYFGSQLSDTHLQLFHFAVVNLTLIDLPGLTKVAVGGLCPLIVYSLFLNLV